MHTYTRMYVIVRSLNHVSLIAHYTFATEYIVHIVHMRLCTHDVGFQAIGVPQCHAGMPDSISLAQCTCATECIVYIVRMRLCTHDAGVQAIGVPRHRCPDDYAYWCSRAQVSRPGHRWSATAVQAISVPT